MEPVSFRERKRPRRERVADRRDYRFRQIRRKSPSRVPSSRYASPAGSASGRNGARNDWPSTLTHVPPERSLNAGKTTSSGGSVAAGSGRLHRLSRTPSDRVRPEPRALHSRAADRIFQSHLRMLVSHTDHVGVEQFRVRPRMAVEDANAGTCGCVVVALAAAAAEYAPPPRSRRGRRRTPQRPRRRGSPTSVIGTRSVTARISSTSSPRVRRLPAPRSDARGRRGLPIDRRRFRR